jgi:hypothetical protein
MRRGLRVVLWTIVAVLVLVASGVVGLRLNPRKSARPAAMPPMMAKMPPGAMMGGGMGGPMPGVMGPGMPGGAPGMGGAPGAAAPTMMASKGMAPASEARDAAAPVSGAKYTAEAPAPGGESAPPGVAFAETSRKLVRTAQVSLETRETGKTVAKLEALAREMGGFVGSSALSRSPQGGQQGSVALRVPVARFDDALDGVRRLGTVLSLSSGVQDVTGEYVDLAARITNARREETEVAKLFARSGKLADIITVADKLSQVRERIEQYEAQIRSMREQTDLSTITVTVMEPGEVVVPEPPAYSAEYHVGNALRALATLGQGLLTVLIYVVMVGWVVWLPALVAWWLLARRRREGPPPAS